MMTRISPRDWEALSAYLDGQLNQKEHARLEKRLQFNAELSLALEDLRRTRAVLRSQPRLRAPRNFTLTPEMVGRAARRGTASRQSGGLFPALRFASALASILLVFVLFADVLKLGPAAAPLPQQVDQFSTQGVTLMERQAAPEAAAEARSVTEAPAAAAEAPAATEAPAALAQDAATQTETFQLFATPTLGPTQAADNADESLPYPGPTGVMIATPVEAGQQTEKSLAATPYPFPGAADQVPAVGTPETTSRGFWTGLRALEVTLALLALGTGIAAFTLRRSGR